MSSGVDGVFKSLADPNRRKLLDRLFRRDGQTLGELCERLAMTRFGVMKHLRVLEEAGLVVTRRAGREKLHYLNPAPNRLVLTWHVLWDKELSNELSRVTYLIEKRGEVCKLTVTHELPEAPKTARQVGQDGWQLILSGLKTLLETGQPMPMPAAAEA